MTGQAFQVPAPLAALANPDGTPTNPWRVFFTMLAQRAGSNYTEEGFVSTSGTFYPLSALLNVTGALQPFGGSVVPDGWLLCNGQAVSRTTYVTLFEVLGTSWGIGDGHTTFNLPNFALNPAVPWTPESALLPILAQINWIIKT